MNTTAPSFPRLDEGLSTLAAEKDLVLCDVWGVIHNGVRQFEVAVDALCRFRQRNGTVVLITNAPVPDAKVRERLDQLGVPRAAYDGIATAGDVAVDLIIEAGCPPIFTIGPEEDVAIYQEVARRGTRPPPKVEASQASLALCTGLDDTGDLPSEYDGVLARLLAFDLTLICANPDIVVEVGHALIYCAGAIAERYAALGGTVVQTGKPHAKIYERAIAMANAFRGVTSRSRMLAIGDGLATDIAGACGQDIASLFITSGIHRAQLHGSPESTVLDPIALARFLQRSSALPHAASPHLIW